MSHRLNLIPAPGDDSYAWHKDSSGIYVNFGRGTFLITHYFGDANDATRDWNDVPAEVVQAVVEELRAEKTKQSVAAVSPDPKEEGEPE